MTQQSIDSSTLHLLPANHRFLAQELLTRGAKIQILEGTQDVMVVDLNGKREYIFGVQSSIVPLTAANLANDKFLSKTILSQQGIQVCRGARFNYGSRFAASSYYLELNSRAVIKPVVGTNGIDVFLPIDSLAEFDECIENFSYYDTQREFLVEEYFEGREYRVLITKNGDFAVLFRDPAKVIGDGRSTIREIAERESYHRMNPRTSCLCEILLDDPARTFLAKSGKDFEYIPAKDEVVYLRANSNLKGGGTCEDVTDKVHPSVIEIAKRVLASFPGLPYAGLDFISTNITAPQDPECYRLIEVNVEPAIGIHMNPWRGNSINVAAWIVDMIFPTKP